MISANLSSSRGNSAKEEETSTKAVWAEEAGVGD